MTPPPTARIVLVVRTFPKGSETFIASKVAGLLRRGWDLRVVCWESPETEWSRFPELRRIDDVRRRVHLAPPTRPAWKAALAAGPAVARAAASNPRGMARAVTARAERGHPGPRAIRGAVADAAIIRCRPDLVHFEFGPLAVGRVDLARRLGARVVVSFRGYDLNFVGIDEPGYYRAVWERADALHLLGRDLWDRAVGRGCPPDKVHRLIPPGIDTTFFDPGAVDAPGREGEPPRLRILSVGRLDWRKGYEDAAVALGIARRAGIELEWRVIGDGPYLESAAFAARQAGVLDRTTFVGPADADRVRAELAATDLFVHAAVSEGFCNAVIEAQSMRVPVVSTDAGGLPENVADGETGVVVPRRDPEALAVAVRRLAADPGLRRRLGEAGRVRAVEEFDISANLDAFEELYRDILG